MLFFLVKSKYNIYLLNFRLKNCNFDTRQMFPVQNILNQKALIRSRKTEKGYI